MRNPFSKRVRALLLVLVMLLSLTATVFAEGTRGPTSYANPFRDVKAGKYYYDAVLWAFNHEPQVASGMNETTFGVNNSCTRAQIATFLYAAAGKPEIGSVDNPFTDVKAGKWYYDAVMWAVQSGVTGGMTDTFFGVNETCTRAQAVTFLYAMAGKPEIEVNENPFTDVPEGKWFYDAVLWAYQNGVTGGTTETTFSPNAKCTRGQIVTFLFKAIDEYEGFVSELNENDCYERADSEELGDASFGDYQALLEQAQNAKTLDERFLLFAQAEAALLDTAAILPTTSQGGNYALSRVAPRTTPSVLYGNDSSRFHNAVVANELLPTDVRDEIEAKWLELKGTGTFEMWVRDYLTGRGFELKDSYTLNYTSDPLTWDVLNTYRSADLRAIVNTFDGLLEYDMEGTLQPALGTGCTVSKDGLTYTFSIRQGVVWTDSQGRKVDDLTADDFVAGLQHLCDAWGGLETLAAHDGAKIKNAQEYINGEILDFSEVGIEALDDYTLEFTLEEPVPYFPSMLTTAIFAPLCRSYYESLGGKFGADYDCLDPNYTYGTDPDHIAYCGPYLVTNATEDFSIVFEVNPLYWNEPNVTVKTITWLYNDGADALKPYTDTRNGVIDGCELSIFSIEAAKNDGLFDLYAYLTEATATTYFGNLNLNRGTFALEDGACASSKTEQQKADTATALNNKSFRKALTHALDRARCNAANRGEELAEANLRNTITPPEFVKLENAVTDKNGHRFPAGTFYGDMVQYYCDQLGCLVDCADGQDGWYKPEAARAYLQAARIELGGNVTWPIQIDVVYPANMESLSQKAFATKDSIEETLGAGNVVVNLIAAQNYTELLYCSYYIDFGSQANYDYCEIAGWSPDYGDPSTYLNEFDPSRGYSMLRFNGLGWEP